MLRTLLILCSLIGTGEASVQGPESALVELKRSRHLMGTRCTINLFHESESAALEAVQSAFGRISELESVLSTWREDSELSVFNGRAGQAPVEVSHELGQFLELSLSLAARTGGAFDPTVGPLVSAWDLRGKGRIAGAGELSAARDLVGFDKLRHDPASSTASLAQAGTWLDAGALGKGMALDAAAASLRAQGVQAALLDFGGQLLALGSPPGRPGWRVGIADPLERGQVLVELELRDASVATSSQNERVRWVEGQQLGHVLDPRTGRPVHRRGSASVIAQDAATADALSTALLVMGPTEGAAWLERQPDSAGAWLRPTADGESQLVATNTFMKYVARNATARTRP